MMKLLGLDTAELQTLHEVTARRYPCFGYKRYRYS
jgi:hypothetical protein